MARMLTTEEVAGVLRIAQRTVVELIGRGELAGTRVGKRRWVVSEAAVEAYVAALHPEPMKGPMTSTTLPDIDRDRLEGFRKMAHAVIDDAVEAGITLAARNERTIVALAQQVTADHEAEAAAVLDLNHATGGSALNLTAAVAEAVDLIATLRHRIDEAQKQMSAIAADRGLVDVDVFRGDDGVIVVEIGCNDPVRITLADGTHLHGPVRVTPEFVETTKQEMLRSISEPLPGAAQLAAIPVEHGPFVITMKVPQGRRFWAPFPSGEGNSWCISPDTATRYSTRTEAEAAKPRRSAVVTLADAHELVLAEKIVSLTPPADAPTGPEAA